MTDDDNITPAWGKARKAAYAASMKKLNSVDLTKPWTLPPFTELDEYGLPVSGGDLPDGGAPSPNSRALRPRLGPGRPRG